MLWPRVGFFFWKTHKHEDRRGETRRDEMILATAIRLDEKSITCLVTLFATSWWEFLVWHSIVFCVVKFWWALRGLKIKKMSFECLWMFRCCVFFCLLVFLMIIKIKINFISLLLNTFVVSLSQRFVFVFKVLARKWKTHKKVLFSLFLLLWDLISATRPAVSKKETLISVYICRCSCCCCCNVWRLRNFFEHDTQNQIWCNARPAIDCVLRLDCLLTGVIVMLNVLLQHPISLIWIFRNYTHFYCSTNVLHCQ